MLKPRITKFVNNYPIVPALVAGILIGVGARVLKLLVSIISRFATSGFSVDHSNLWMIALGVAAIVLSGAFARKVIKLPMEHSSERMTNDLQTGAVDMPGRLTFAPIVASSMTLGLGGSAGAEGPIAYAGAAIGSNVAYRLGLSPRYVAAFLACGGAAGIAAIFKAPVGGMFFAIEVLKYTLAVPELIILATMCLAAGLTAFALGNFTPDVSFPAFEAFEPRYILPALILGVVCGLYSMYYIKTGNFTARKLEGVRNPWIRNLIAGLVLGVSLFLFPSLYGEGYGVLGQVLNGDLAVVTEGTFAHGLRTVPLTAICLGCILLIKSFATYATNSGGGIAGDFAPTIFAGGMLGALYAMGATLVPAWPTLPFGDFILMGMAGVMAGAIQAPLMAIFLVVEMTASPTLLLPVSIVALIGYLIPYLFRKCKRRE